MKNSKQITITRCVLVFLLLTIQCPESIAQNDIRNIDNIFCIGNGKMAEYGAGADIIQIFGPPYSAPSLLDLKLADSTIQVLSTREEGTAIWTHELKRGNLLIGKVVDLMDTLSPIFIRRFEMSEPVIFNVHVNGKTKLLNNTSSYLNLKVTGAMLAESPRGTAFYNDYPMPYKQFMQVVVKGNAIIDTVPVSGNFQLHVSVGKSFVYIVGGPLYPDCISFTHAALSTSYESIESRVRIFWKSFTERRKDFEKSFSAGVPDRKKLLWAIDAVAVNCKTQQSTAGGVLAGHNYHLGYVRDQYGVSRGLLKMGFYTEARGILDFFWQRWKQKAVIHNAQGIDIDIFHMHENDEVEITGYLIIQAFDYLEKTNDRKFVSDIFPMLEWAFNAQAKNLFRNMLPFNGDETYIAGGILPRSCMNDGSAEATLLFITGGKKLISWAGKNARWNEATVRKSSELIDSAAGQFSKNFYPDNILYCNNPKRSVGMELPLFRHGVCEGLGEGCEFYGWTQKNEYGRYLCPVCFINVKLGEAKKQTYRIQSVSLMPLYIGSTLFPGSEVQTQINPLVKNFETTGRMPSRPDGNTTVGYDYGLLLYNLTRLHDQAAADVYKKMMSLIDHTGSWVEYYENDHATGTRYRPWESAINIEAAIEYAETIK